MRARDGLRVSSRARSRRADFARRCKLISCRSPADAFARASSEPRPAAACSRKTSRAGCTCQCQLHFRFRSQGRAAARTLPPAPASTSPGFYRVACIGRPLEACPSAPSPTPRQRAPPRHSRAHMTHFRAAPPPSFRPAPYAALRHHAAID